MSGNKLKKWDESDVRNFLITNGLYRGKFYKDLETSSTSDGYDKYCGTPENPLCGSMDVRNICAAILNYLENIYTQSDHTNDVYDVCKLLNYWVYKRLNLVLDSNNSSYIKQTHGVILREWNSFNDDVLINSKYKTCKPIDNIVVHNDWEKRKELYEYYADYQEFKAYLGIYTPKCKEFYEYIESKKPLYEHFKSRCSDNNQNMCPEFYSQCVQYDPDNVLQHLSCHEQIVKERAVAAPSVLERGDTHSGSETEPRGTPVGMMPVGDHNSNGKSHNVGMYGNVLLGVVATSMTSGALYRFTPLGGMIRNGLGWNKNNMRNFNGGDIRLYDYSSEPFNPYPGEEHYIGYHPA